MKVVITGGTGLIGHALAEDLLRDGHEVVLVSRHAARDGDLPAGARWARWDGSTAAGWGSEVERADAVVNLAGASLAGEGLLAIPFQRWSAARKEVILSSRVRAGQAVVEAVAAARDRPKVLVQSSAVGYYGVGEAAVDEQAPPGSDFLARVCQAWEASTQAVEEMGVRRAIVRTALVLSRRGGLFPIMVLPFRLFVGGRLGSGRAWFPWVHIRDEVRAIRHLLETPEARGPFNLAVPEAVRSAEFTRVLAGVLHRPTLLPMPAFLLRLALGEKATLVLEGQRPTPRRLAETGFTFEFPELEGALRELLL